MRFSVAYTDTEYATLPPVGEPAGPHGAEDRARAGAGRSDSSEPAPPLGLVDLRRPRAARWRPPLYLFTARAVHVDVVPADAAVSLEGSWLPREDRRPLPAAAGRLPGPAWQATGYEPQTQDITVGDARARISVTSWRSCPVASPSWREARGARARRD